MSKIIRKVMKVFGSTAGASQVAQFGSLAAGSPTFSTDPATIQGLGAWLSGWFNAVTGSNSPAIEDVNAMAFVLSYGLCYLHQSGVAEWEAGTTYYAGSLVSDGVGGLYSSLTDNNLNNALTVGTNWRRATGPTVSTLDPAVTPAVTLTASDNGRSLLINTANGPLQLTLPAVTGSFSFSVKDTAGYASQFPITVVRAGTPTLEGLGVTTVALACDFGAWTWQCDGTNWSMV